MSAYPSEISTSLFVCRFYDYPDNPLYQVRRVSSPHTKIGTIAINVRPPYRAWSFTPDIFSYASDELTEIAGIVRELDTLIPEAETKPTPSAD